MVALYKKPLKKQSDLQVYATYIKSKKTIWQIYFLYRIIERFSNGRFEMNVIPQDVLVRYGEVHFGLKDNGGVLAIALPQFDIRKRVFGDVTTMVRTINDSPRLRQDNECEALLRKAIGKIDVRFIVRDGNLVPLDQEAASILQKQGLPLLKNRHYIPIK